MAELAFERLYKPKAKARRAFVRDEAHAHREPHSWQEPDHVVNEDLLEWATRAPDPGDPLSPALRADLEQKLGRDLSHVRVHTGDKASRAAAAAGATAFTRGANIFLASPQRATDLRLLSHELAHVVQQGAAPPLRLATATRAAVSSPVPRAASAAPGPAPVVQREEDESVLATLRRAGGTVASGVRSGVSAVTEGAESLLDLGREGQLALGRRIAPDLVAMFEGGGISRFLRNMIARGVSTLINRVLTPMRSALNFDNIADQFGAASTALSEARTSLEQQICDGVLGAARRVSAFFSETFGPVVDWFRSMADSVSQAFNDLWNSLGAPVMDWLRRAGGAIWESLQGFISDIAGLIRRARTALGDGWDTVKGWLSIQADDGETEGGGLWNWVRDKVSEVGGAIADMIRPVLGPLRTAAGVLLLMVPGGQLLVVIGMWPRIRQAFDWLSAQWQELNLIPRAREFWANVLLPQLMDGAERIGVALAEALDWAVGLLGRIGDTIARAVSSRLEGILEPLNALVAFAHAEFTRMITWGRTTLRAASRNMRQILNRLIALGRTILDGLLTLISIVLNPFGISGFLLGTLWRLIPDCLKGPFIDFILDVLIGFIRLIPPLPQIGLLWPFVRAGLLGFFEQVRSFAIARKVNVSNRIARIVSGMNPAFFLGFLRGIAIGLFELIAGPFQALAAMFQLPTLLQNFLSNLGVRLCDLIESIRCFAANLAGRVFGGLDGILSAFSELIQNPGRILELIQCAIEGALAAVERLGATLAERLMGILEGAEDVMGEMIGRITASLVGNALISYFTAGIGTAVGVVGRIASALRAVGTAMRQAMRVLGGLLRQSLRFVRALASRFGGAVAGGARSALSGIGGFLRRGARWFGRLLGRAFRGLRRRFGLSPAQRLQWAEFRVALRSRLEGHPNGIRRSELRRLYQGVLNSFRGVAKWPAFITKHGPHWRLWVRRVKSLRPRRVGRVLLDHNTRFRQGMNEVKRAVGRLKRGPENLTTPRIRMVLPSIQRRFRFSSLRVDFEPSLDDFRVTGSMSPPLPWRTKPRRPRNNGPLEVQRPSREVTVDPVTKNRLRRSSASGTPALWPEVSEIRTDGDASLYVKGHLISGWYAPGSAANLTPISRRANTQMELLVEGPVFASLLGWRSNRPVYKYLTEAVGTAGNATLRRRKIRGRWVQVPEERQLARQINIRLTTYQYNPSNGRWDQAGRVRSYGPVRNVPPFPRGKDE